MRCVLLDVLDLIEDFAFLATGPNFNRMSRYAGHIEMRAAYRAFERWQAEKYLEKVERGKRVLYQIGPAGKKFLSDRRPCAEARRRSWDGKWRMVVFDFPEVARKARDAFRRELRWQRMGCLQKSVWITPNPVIPAWKQLLKETDLTEWVLLFESAELGPVDDVEIATKVWRLNDLIPRYERYLDEFRDLPNRLRMARPSALEGELGRKCRRECQQYLTLLDDDPILPAQLLPRGYPALKADALHVELRRALRSCLFG
jgi:phenylacetic acid degradation operon negative regulatory protein